MIGRYQGAVNVRHACTDERPDGHIDSLNTECSRSLTRDLPHSLVISFLTKLELLNPFVINSFGVFSGIDISPDEHFL